MKVFLKNDLGIAAVEFALIAPLLIGLFIGVVDIGMYMNDKMKVEATARAVAEYLIFTKDEDGAEENIITPYYAGMITIPHTVDIELSCECGDGEVIDCLDDTCAGDDYKRRFYNVSLIKTHNTLFVYPGFASSIELNGQAKMQVD